MVVLFSIKHWMSKLLHMRIDDVIIIVSICRRLSIAYYDLLPHVRQGLFPAV